jgi:hypothetical protein
MAFYMPYATALSRYSRGRTLQDLPELMWRLRCGAAGGNAASNSSAVGMREIA